LSNISCNKKIKVKQSGIDYYVPTDKEVKYTLSKLSNKNKLVYLVYLVSGIRKKEGIYLLENIKNLKTQEKDGFVKIEMKYHKGNKNNYFCYLPLKIYNKLTKTIDLSVYSLEKEIKQKKLVSIKYCRKWQYTKCVELGIPESIADYYQGRVSNSIGENHYLSRQMLADKNYSKIINYIKYIN